MHQFIRLNKSRDNPKLFWRIAESLLRRSTSFATLLMYETFLLFFVVFFFKLTSKTKILRSMKLSRRIPKLKLTPLWSQRKRNTESQRGNPIFRNPQRTLTFISPRITNHPTSLTKPLQSSVSARLYKRSRVCYAWRQIHEEVLDSPNIYEFDLRQFFNSINLDYLHKLLIGVQIPKTLLDHIITWCRTPAKNSPYCRKRWKSPLHEMQDYKYHVTGVYKITTYEELHYWTDRKRKAEKHNPLLKRYDYFHGVAQGSGISPIVSLLVITKDLLLTWLCKFVQYADDGLIYNYSSEEDPLNLVRFPE